MGWHPKADGASRHEREYIVVTIWGIETAGEETCTHPVIHGGAKKRMFLKWGICDFFLWGYLKSKVYVWKPRTVDDLKVYIREEIATVPQEMLVNVMQNSEERLRTCVRQEGRHLSDIIFRKWIINVGNQTAYITGWFDVDIIFYIENKKSYNYLKKIK
jgi:hypothetical protein